MINNLRTSGDYRLKDLRTDKKSEVANHPLRIRRILVPIRLRKLENKNRVLPSCDSGVIRHQNPHAGAKT